MFDLKRLFNLKMVMGLGIIILIGLVGVGIYLEYSEFGYIDYIPKEMQRYKDYLYKIKNAEITKESIYHELLEVMPNTEAEYTVKEKQALTATVLTLIEERSEILTKENNRNYCSWMPIISMTTVDTEDSKSGEKNSKLRYLKQKSLNKLENMADEIIANCGESGYMLSFYQGVTKSYELDPNVYRLFTKNAEKYISRDKKRFSNRINKVQEKIKKLEEQLNEEEAQSSEKDEIDSLKERYNHLKKVREAKQETYQKIRNNIQKASQREMNKKKN